MEVFRVFVPTRARVVIEVPGTSVSGGYYVDEIHVASAFAHGVSRLPGYCAENMHDTFPVAGNPTRLHVTNGSIQHLGENSYRSNNILLREGTFHRVTNVNSMVVKGVNGRNIFGHEANDLTIHNNVVENQSYAVVSRDNGVAAIDVEPLSALRCTVTDNVVLDSPQYGIRLTGRGSGSSTVTGNQIGHLTLNDLGEVLDFVGSSSVVTQGFGIGAYGDSMLVENNKVFMDNGRGIHVGRNGSTIRNNLIRVSKGRNQEYDRMTAYGIQFEGSTNNIEVYENRIMAFTHPRNGSAAGLRFTSITGANTGINVFDNDVEAFRNAESLPSDPNTARLIYAAAISVVPSDIEPGVLTGVHIFNTPQGVASGKRFRSNHKITNSNDSTGMTVEDLTFTLTQPASSDGDPNQDSIEDPWVLYSTDSVSDPHSLVNITLEGGYTWDMIFY